ncbi:phosphoserine phosphatase SerB [Allosphingosinicella sp.]|uniref:phosphoserine phosphatase SerB n=1 Tax=Allosphingosinicella sp. TaxID=2823234 RepID=UPI002FC12E8F
MFIATLIAARRISSGDISLAEDALRERGIEPMGRSWIEEDKACDILFSADPTIARDALEGMISGADLVVQGEAGRRKRLLVADMDSTMITVECIDELADYAGRKAEVAEITERAMRGEIDFTAALRDRVALLKGLEEAVLDRCHDERVRITPGARALVRTMRREGAYCLLVSGGFSAFADRVAGAIGFDGAVANTLLVEEGRLSGTVGEPIVGAEGKLQALIDAAEARAIELGESLAIGDGANDIPMLKAAGLGVAYHAKPKVAAAADARIEHGDVGALLFAQGYARSEWEAN